MTVKRCASVVCTVRQVVELSPMPWISRIAGPGPGDPERAPVAVDGAELQRRA